MAYQFLIDAGVPRYNRRLTDKVLAAFNHAYAMGEMRLTRFAGKLDEWAQDDADPLLRATAVDAREKLRHAAAAAAGVDALSS